MCEFFKGVPLQSCLLENLRRMVPKKDILSRLKDFRPISLCSVSYKIFSKNLTTRLSSILTRVISLEQGAFVQDSLIVENNDLAEELMRTSQRRHMKETWL